MAKKERDIEIKIGGQTVGKQDRNNDDSGKK